MQRDQYFEDVELGESTVENTRPMTEADVVNFASITGDWSKIHVSEPFAAATEFGGRLVMEHLVNVVADAIGIDWSLEAFSYGHDNVRFIQPVFNGNTITVNKGVTEHEDYDENLGRIVITYEVENQHGGTVLVNDHILMVRKRASLE